MTTTLETYDPMMDREEKVVDQELDRGSAPVPGTLPSTYWLSGRNDFTQAELAEILQVSDRTVRKYLVRLREIYYWQVELLTLPSGRYSQFALCELVKLQQAIAVFVPMASGDAVVLAKNSNKISYDAYRDLVWEQQAPEPEPELQATSIVLASDAQRLETVEDLEQSFETLDDLKDSIGSRYVETVKSFRDLGEQLAAESVRALSESFNTNVTEGMKALSETGKSNRKKKP